MKERKNTSFITKIKPFLIGSLSGSIASCVIQPIDTVKVLIQAKKQDAGRNVVNLSPFAIAREVAQKDGILALYRGLDAAIMRQFIYCGARLGIYKWAEDDIKEREGRNMTFWEKMGWSLFSGAFGSLVATPTDVALIRFQADNNLPPEKRRNYKNVLDALLKMYKEQGVRGMWTGATPTMFRAMSINCSQLVTYNEAKQALQGMYNTKEETMTIRMIASAIAGIAVTVFSLPFDNIKTKMMRMKKNEQGILPYSGFFNCFAKSIKNQGVLGLWVGIGTYYSRIAPHAMITVLAQDLFHDLFKKYNY